MKPEQYVWLEEPQLDDTGIDRVREAVSLWSKTRLRSPATAKELLGHLETRGVFVFETSLLLSSNAMAKLSTITS